MENGVDVVERSVELGEKQGLVDGVSGEGLGEGAVIAPRERKDSEGEEFFQEAIGTKEQLPEQVSDVQQGDNTIESGIVAEQGVNVGHEDSVVSSDVKSVDESNVMVERGMDVEQGGSIVGFDVDTIPQTSVGTVGESLDVANEVEKFEEAVGVLREAENGVEDAIVGDQGEDSVDAATASGSEATTVKCNGEGDRELGNNGENWTQESAEVDAVVGMQNSKGGNENVETSGVAFENSETEESDNVVLQKGQAVESSENGTVHPDGESNGKILHEETENNGTSSEYNLGKEYRDEEAGHAADLSGDHNTEPQDDEGTKLTDTLASGGHEFSKSMEEKGATIELNSEHVDDNGEDMDAISNITHEGSHHNGEPETTSAGFELSANKGTELLDNQSSPYTKDSVDNEIQSDAGDLRLKDYHGSQPQDTGGGLSNTVYSNGNGAVRKELQNKGKVHEEQQAEAKKEQEVRPAADVGSSSAKSTNAATLPARPAGLGRAAPLLEPAPRVAQHPRANGSVTSLQAQQSEEPKEEGDEYDETREKLQMIRVKFLRLAHRLGQTPHNVVVAQVLYRLGLAEQLRGRSGGRVGAFSFDRASAMAEQLEAAGQEPLDFSCTIMVLGKTGVGKSATINSIFDEPKFSTDAFQTGTRKVQDVVGTVQGIKVRVIDTPGLLPSWSDQHCNEKILQSVKRFIKKTPPDIVLYLDRLDMQSRDLSDMPLLRTITEIFGPSIWFNAIVVLTHAASAPPDGPNGSASSYDMFVTQRSHVVQQAIRQAAGDMRLMNPVSLVENHSACRTNRAGQRVLPNGQVWKPHLLLLSFASKILAEANALLKLQDSPPGKPFVTRSRAPPLPFLLSSLLQSRPQLKLPEEQNGDDDDLEDDLDDSSDSDDEPDYDDLPPFISLSKAQLAKLPKDQRKAYFDELEYREKLFMKKQLKEERKRRKIMKKMAAAAKDLRSEFSENVEEESGSTASVPVPMPDLALPASFDSDNPTHRYRYLDTSNPWLVRPVLETHGWDHDVGYEGINVERMFVVKQKVPVSFSGQVTKDKKDANLQMEAAGSIKHGEGKATNLGFDLQTVGKDIAYTLRSETRFSNYKKNKATAGLSVTLLGDAVSAGVKFEDKLIVNKRFQMVMSGGAMSGRGDIAYGGSLEAQLRDKDYPLGRSLSTLGLSVMDWHGDLAIGCNLQSQIPVGRSTNLIARANLNNRGAGQVSVRLNSSEQLQLVLVGLLPLLRKLFYVSQQQFEQ